MDSRILLMGLLSAYALSSCEKCEGPPNAHETSIGFNFLNSATGLPLFRPGSTYSADSLKLTTQVGVAVPFDAFSFQLLPRSEAPALNQRISQTYFLRFSRSDQDTIRLDYELFENDCSRPEYKSLMVFYNGRPLYQGGHPYGLIFDIGKP